MLAFALVSVFFCLLCSVSAVRPYDQIIVNNLPGGPQNLSIANEVYAFTLYPKYWVPLQMNKHVIYTSSTQGATKIAKRVLYEKRSQLYSLSAEDYDFVSSMFTEPLPAYLKVDSTKRSIVTSSGVRRIDLAPEHYLFVLGQEEGSIKRHISEVNSPIGGQVTCLHIPFFTTCDNSADLNQLKAVIQQQNDALRTELDSYKRTNDARDRELTNALNKQRDLVKQLAQVQQNSLSLIQRLVSVEKTNLVQTQHGDQIIHAQVNSLKRVTNSILRFDNALGSTDPRSTVAQPALSKLFSAYLSVIANFTAGGKSPILDSRMFNFTEQVLPDQAVKNVSETGLVVEYQDPPGVYRGFYVTLEFTCPVSQITVDRICNVSASPPTVSKSGWMIGPFHKNHYGIYNVKDDPSPSGQPLNSREATFVVPPTGPNSGTIPPLFGDTFRCVNFLGHPVWANFDTTPNLLNGIPSPTDLPPEECNSVRIFANSNGPTLYRMFVYAEGITVPFYSNCNMAALKAVGISYPIGYMSGYPNTNTAYNADSFVADVAAHHYVSANCFVSLEPEWVGMTYFINPVTNVIRNIPRGYKANQFTINPAGELASSLEFVYTPQWALTYDIKRTSTNLAAGGNRIVVDEIDVLDGDKVLLVNQSDTIIDASDSFFGEGNNGRDCIQVPLGGFSTMQFDYDLTDCFFQNDKIGYPISQYVKGVIRTTGISRFIDKFTMQLTPAIINNLPSFTFTLTPKSNADFRFYVVQHPDVCPTITRRAVGDKTCTFDFFYSGTDPVTFGSTPITFTNQAAFNIMVPTSTTPYSLSAGTKSCLQVTCRQTVNSTYLLLETPSFAVVSEDDKNLETVTYSLDVLMANSIRTLNEIDANASIAKGQIDHIMDLFSQINFNVSQLFPYENFSDLRKQVDAQVAKIATNYCSGPFDSIQCWLKSSASILIACAVIIVVVSIVCFILVKTGYAQKLKGKLFPKRAHHDSDNCETPKTKSTPKTQEEPAGFELIATN